MWGQGGSAVMIPAGEASTCREGAPWPRQLLMLLALVLFGTAMVLIMGGVDNWATKRIEVFVAIAGIACWRWSWFFVQNARAILYRYYAFPRLRREAALAVERFGPVPEVIVLATTYHEKPWITDAVFTSVFEDLAAVEGLTARPRVIVVTGCDQDDSNIREVFARCCGGPTGKPATLWPPELTLLRGDKGKRQALGTGMEEICRGKPRPDGVVVIIDGDTMFQPGLLRKVLPVFRLSPPVAGVTSNENGFVKGPAWFAEWTSLRFGLRHRSMCSVSYSGKLLCLTGRFSVFRTAVVTDPSFKAQVEHDHIDHWLWGRFEMLSGDDKSTWYWLAKHRQRMLYIPDAMVTTFEVVSGSAIHRAMANVRRWSGNSVRHGWRAIMLGPGTLGFFLWWSLIDQRLTMITVLFGPAVALLSLCTGHVEMAAGYFLWVLCSRVCHAAIAWQQGRRLSAYYIPLQVISDWIAALTKLWVLFHPAKQNWLNRGARTLNSTKGSAFYSLRTSFAHYLYGFTCVAVLTTIGVFAGFLPLGREGRLFFTPSAAPPPAPGAVPAGASPSSGGARPPRQQAGGLAPT
ncbi:MAG TPA: hypothetical protein DCM86_04465, partial [Verrucomicrobiales bacterium]|nr:hypothetical protein [Verrucomicrobiales bacterium]